MSDIPKRALLGAGAAFTVAGLVLINVNLTLGELAKILGTNLVVDGTPADYSAPPTLYIVPIILLVAGLGTLAISAKAGRRIAQRVEEHDEH